MGPGKARPFVNKRVLMFASKKTVSVLIFSPFSAPLLHHNGPLCVSLFCCRNFMNDSLRTNVFVRFSPKTVAVSCLFLAARQLQVSGGQGGSWHASLHSLMLEGEFEDVCMHVYST